MQELENMQYADRQFRESKEIAGITGLQNGAGEAEKSNDSDILAAEQTSRSMHEKAIKWNSSDSTPD